MTQTPQNSVFKRMLSYMRPYKLRIAAGLVASLGVATADGLVAWVVKPGVDLLVIDRKVEFISYIPVVILGIALLKGVSRFGQGYFMQTAANLMVRDVRNAMFGHTVRQPISFFGERSVGGLMSRVMNDVALMQSSVAQTVVDMVREGATLLGLIVVALYRDWQMALVVFTVMPFVGYVGSSIGKRIKSYTRRGQESVGLLNTVAEQSFSAIKVLKSFDAEGRMAERFQRDNNGWYGFTRKSIKYENLTAPCLELLTAIGLALVTWMGVSRTISGAMTPGDLLSVIAAVGLIYSPVKKLAHINNRIQQALGAADRVFEVLDHPLAITDAADAPALQVTDGAVRFDHVHFAYGDAPLFRDFSLDVRPGERLALVGPSGSGKTSLAALLSRFFVPQQGRILIDGQDIQVVSQASLRAQIAMVDQEAVLFNDTVRGNIRLGCADATEEQVRWAAEQAYAHDFIMGLPQQYDTVIGDRGLRISGGQRQRLCIARALLKNAPILILDEATSALDTESEAMVQQALENLMQGRTTLVIAHRLSTIMGADRIVVLHQGQVVETGNHAELLAADGMYKRLYDMQFQSGED